MREVREVAQGCRDAAGQTVVLQRDSLKIAEIAQLGRDRTRQIVPLQQEVLETV